MVRAFEPGDRSRYLQLARAFYHSPAVLHPVPESHMERTWEQIMAGSPYVEAVALVAEETVVGYGLVSKTWSQEAGGMVCWLEEAYLLEQYRGRGLGHEFFDWAEKCCGRGCCRFRLEIEPDNHRARKLYESLGYRPLGYAQMVKE